MLDPCYNLLLGCKSGSRQLERGQLLLFLELEAFHSARIFARFNLIIVGLVVLQKVEILIAHVKAQVQRWQFVLTTRVLWKLALRIVTLVVVSQFGHLVHIGLVGVLSKEKGGVSGSLSIDSLADGEIVLCLNFGGSSSCWYGDSRWVLIGLLSVLDQGDVLFLRDLGLRQLPVSRWDLLDI